MRLLPHPELGDFTSNSPPLDEWLQVAAPTADRSGTARVYLCIDDEDRLAGYFAIAPSLIRQIDLPRSLGRGAPETVPSFLIARLALAASLQGQGRGSDLLVVALRTTLAAIGLGGGRLIVVDAIDERAVGYYAHHGFRPTPVNPARLVIKASTAAASVDVPWP